MWDIIEYLFIGFFLLVGAGALRKSHKLPDSLTLQALMDDKPINTLNYFLGALALALWPFVVVEMVLVTTGKILYLGIQTARSPWHK